MVSHDRPRSIDLEKNIHDFVPLPFPSTSKKLIYILTPIHIMLTLLVLQHRTYLDSLHSMFNSLLLGVLTSGLAQCIIQCFRPVHYGKLYKFYVWGALNGVISSMWIDFLLTAFPESSQALNRFLADQILAGPLFQLVFMSYHCLWEDLDLLPTLKIGFLKNLGASYCVWPIASIIGFGGFIREGWIFPFNCFVSLVWTVVLGVLN